MLMFSIFFLPLLYLPSNYGEPLIEDRDVYHTLFGKIGSMEDLFLKDDGKPQPPKPSTKPEPDDDDFEGLDISLPEAFNSFKKSKLTNHTFDIQDFLVINEKYSKIAKEYKQKMKDAPRNDTRRRHQRVWYLDPDDAWYGESVEEIKRRQLTMVLVQFVMHCRYEVGKALLQRNMIRDDKRYKLGYLFNRMRRLKTEQLKMVGAAWVLVHNNEYRHMYTIIRLYERVVHFDVDMRDTANLIKKVFAISAPYDMIEHSKRAPTTPPP